MKYEATKKSLGTHEVPKWFKDAKLGIFITWGLYSVPAWAPIEYGDINQTLEKGLKFHNANNPYAEWYLNSMKFEEGPYHAHHTETYGSDFKYEDFAPIFKEESQKWNPKTWAKLFAKVGARYIVITSKHHDGFLLWPSDHPHPQKKGYQSDRDLIGELATAVKNQGIHMGVYYSGTIDWSFNPERIDTGVTMLTNGPTDKVYTNYADTHWYEIMERFKPDILWNDIGYPPKGKVEEILSDFYNSNPEGVVNDRWMRTPVWFRKLVRIPPFKWLFNWATNQVLKKGLSALPPKEIGDYATPEYKEFDKITEYSWEACRGIGRSFGYNRMETAEHHLSSEELIRSFVDIVSKNGNLLLNIGPKPDGSIPELQLERLEALGKWLDVYGEAIFDTRPWKIPQTETVDGISIKFTSKPGYLYIHLLDKPKNSEILVQNLTLPKGATLSILSSGKSCEYSNEGPNIKIRIIDHLPDDPVIVLKVEY